MVAVEWVRGKMRGVKRRIYKPLRPKRVVLKQISFLGNQFVVLANEDVGWRLIVYKEYERDEIRCLEQLIRGDDVCVDVGANIGIYSVFMAQQVPDGRIIAYEPIPLNQKIIALNAELNGITNVEIENAILSDTPGMVKFSVSEDSAYSSMRPTRRKQQAKVLLVRADTLDKRFAEEKQHVNVLKLDVEGAELLVLKGGESLLSTPELRPRVLLVELAAENQAVYEYRPEDVIEYMLTLGYNVYSISDGRLKRGWSRDRKVFDAVFIHEDYALSPEIGTSQVENIGWL